MESLVMSPNIDEVKVSARQSSPRVLRGALIVLMSIIYSGGFQFLVSFSPYLLYGFYLALVACIILCMLVKGQVNHDLGAVMPYLIWIALYCFWGTIVAPYKDL